MGDQSADAAPMEGPAGADRECHFSGVHVRMVVHYLQERQGPTVLRSVLDLAKEDRPVEVLLDDAVWASYGQIRRLFEATASVLGGPTSLMDAAMGTPVDSDSSAELAQALQDVGSPDSLLEMAMNPDASFGLSTIRHRSGEQVAPGEWLIRERFTEGFEAFPELCSFQMGALSLIPRLFGLPAGETVEESCCCTGDDFCTFRLRWQEHDKDRQPDTYFETRSRMLESRLKALQQTVADLVSAPDPDAALSRILLAASRSIYAPFYVLFTDPDLPIRPRLLFQGLESPEANRIGEDLLTLAGRCAPGRLCVEVVSNRSHYGWLAAIDPSGRSYLPQEQEVFASYATLAAAALDWVTAFDEARRQATTATTLLELSRHLAQLASPEQIAAHLAVSVRRVVDCDRSLVFLTDAEDVRIVAVDGFTEAVEAQLREHRLPGTALSVLGPDLTYFDSKDAAALCSLYELPDDEIPKATASVPMVANGDVLGCLVVSVMDGPRRLRENDGLNDALRGIAGQGAIAVDNARLIDRIRHQALHDDLTGLGNRTLMIECLERALARARRENLAVATMFIDLDGFKEINDNLGHAAGDEVLTEVGMRLRTVLRSGDTVGRIGGDEFVAVLEGKSLDAGPEVIADRLLNEIRRPSRLSCVTGCDLSITASIGIAKGDRESADEMLRDADFALYRAKATGKDRLLVYNDDAAETAFS
jgi:diguanylate cyclase (GGDEF)-like protein